MSNAYFNAINPLTAGTTIRSAQLNDLFTQLTQAFDLVETDVGNVAADAAAAAVSAANAASSAADAAADAAAADASADAAALSAASINLPAIGPGDELKLLQVKPDLTGYRHEFPWSGVGSDVAHARNIFTQDTFTADLVIDLDTILTPGLHPDLVSPANIGGPAFGDGPSAATRCLVHVYSPSPINKIQVLTPLTSTLTLGRAVWRRRTNDSGANWSSWVRTLEGESNLFGLADLSESRHNVGLYRPSDSPQPADRNDVYLRGSDVFNTGAIFLTNDNWNLVSQGGDIPLKQGLCDFLLPSNGPSGPRFGDFSSTAYMCHLYFHGGHIAPQWITQVAIPVESTSEYLGMLFRASIDGGVTWSAWRDVALSAVESVVDQLNLSAVIRISSLADFPAPVAGVITLLDNRCYEINGYVDITPNRITVGSGTSLRGNGVSASILVGNYPNMSAALLYNQSGGLSIDMMTVINTAATGRTLFADVNGISGVQVISISDSIIGGKYIGYIHGPEFLLLDSVIFCGAAGASARASFGLQINNLGAMTCENAKFQIDSAVGSHAIQFEGIVSEFAKITDCIVDTTGRGIVDNSSTIGADCLEIVDNRFVGGGSYLIGFSTNDARCIIRDNFGITNSPAFGFVYAQNNALATNFSVANTTTKIAFTTTSTPGAPANVKFTHTSPNTLTYVGAKTNTFKVTASASMLKTGAGSSVITIYARVNGVDRTEYQKSVTLGANNILYDASIDLVVTLSNGGTLELWGQSSIINGTVVFQDFQLLAVEV